MPGVQIIYDATCVSTTGVCCLWTVPAGSYNVVFEIWGGGGGGGNPGTNCDCCSRGGPGAGGGYSKRSIAVTPGAQYTVCAGPAGVSGSGFGSLCGICCDGCAGGTSFVLGTNLSNFCATGGLGGKSDFNTNCYAHCGCNFWNRCGGTGCGGDIVANGSFGVMHHYANTNPYGIEVWGGSAGGPGGGSGGINVHGGWIDSASGCACSGAHTLHGRIPGGGGAGSGWYNCCQCTPHNSGRGAPGLVRITY